MKENAMTPDEISELAEFLWMCCAEAEARGDKIVPYFMDLPRQFCPFEAVGGSGNFDFRELTPQQASSFRHGFDHQDAWGPPDHRLDLDLFALGLRFREQALSGEGFR
jgi:hypothetical protein